MKFTLSWLKEHLDTDASVDEIVAALNEIGLEVEGVDDPARTLAAFTVARVREARPHPDADRLRVCDVETKDGLVQVVCGAPNARTGLVGVFAPPGTHIPGTGLDLKPGVIRGVESNGMLCSERELEISEDHDGIIDFREDIPVGTPAAAALGLDDPVFDIAITPNRPDALGVRGVARDLAARGLGTLKPLPVERVAGHFDSPIGVELRFPAESASACPLFVGRYIRGVKNGPSPAWLQRRLRAIGLRPISALVDITNFITFAYGRPLHVFDADKVKGTIHARLAVNGETIEALDGKVYTLDDTMTVIADDAGPEGIAGIMGGEVSGCTEETVNVFVEAAYFDPIRTATTGRKLGIESDARYRFERGIDPVFTETGAEIATAMILDLCGGEASHLVVAGAPPLRNASYRLRMDRVRTLGGVDVPVDEQLRILRALGFGIAGTDEEIVASVPSWRPDVDGEADLVEEIVRIHGLNNVPPAPMDRPDAIARPVLTLMQRRQFAARRALASRGMNEAATWSFLPRAHAELFGGGQESLRLANPISSELSDMRPSLLANLIAAAARNVARGFADVALFEVGAAYAGDAPEDQTTRAAGIRRGHAIPRNWAGPARPVDAYDAKADALAALAAAGGPAASAQVVAGAPAWFHPGRSGTIQLGPKVQLAWFGEIHPRVLDAMDVKGPLVGFELVFDAIPAPKGRSGTARPALDASDLQAVSRDLAFVVDTGVEAETIVKAARGADKKLISDVRVFDVFEGASLGQGRKSVAIEVTLQPRDKTLTDAEIDAVIQAAVQKVTKATGATLRG
ncbi:phenylalanine--tRNA ligase subunit beta [Futiania mangrovi]|uniref:Phenylalanine--tRNA ligase beta subunit n=1 Tax=Futiania mangrovi TaxID=2959716 RepID=A0A9J6PHA0_9PROT|nr:phenylalanine--tRNA ligase subunit beta [Futiania mangrovii]MCP1337179.1 phenylalanine--tRNA ligase subunit beta [Futiania mangrovii]